MSRQILTIGSFDTTDGWGILEVMVKARELLSHNLRRLRDGKEWDQPELASNAGLSHQMIQKIEQQKTSPSQETLDKLCLALNCSVADLYQDDNEIIEFEPIIPHDDHPTNEEILALGVAFAQAQPGKRLLALYLLTRDDSYYKRAAAIPDVALIARVLKKALLP